MNGAGIMSKKQKVVTSTGQTINKKPLGMRIWNHRGFYLMFLPVFIYVLIVYYWPMLGVRYSFYDYTLKKMEFVGFKHFNKMFADADFWKAFFNTLQLSIIKLLITTGTAVIVSVFINEMANMIMKKTVQTISYLPHFLSWIIVTGILHDALSASGTVNEILINLHFVDTYVPFFSIEKYFWPIVAFANCWKETGWNAIVYLAAITSIDPSLYEAASIDGGGRWAKMKYITLPGIKPTIMILLLINIGNVINAGFEIQYLLGNSLIVEVSETIDIYVLRWGISQMDYSLGTAAGIFKSLISIVLIFTGNSLAKTFGEERLF